MAASTNPACSGVFRTPTRQAAERFARAAHLELLAADLAAAAGKASLLERLGRALEFPHWYGGNWDALEDCLTDLSWRPGTGHLLMIEGQAPLQIPQEDASVFLDILGQSAAYWARQGRPFVAVFVDPGGVLSLPALPDK